MSVLDDIGMHRKGQSLMTLVHVCIGSMLDDIGMRRKGQRLMTLVCVERVSA